MKIMGSGVAGLDEVLGGGFVSPSIILIGGSVGTGKTTLALQSLFNSARNKECCLFIASVSEPITSINNFLSPFSFFDPDLKTMHFVDAGELLLMKKDAFGIIKDNIEAINPDRVVIDSFLSLADMDKDALDALIIYMKRRNILLILTDVFREQALNEHYIASIVDGVIFLSIEEGRRWLTVFKLRGQDTSIKKHAFKFTIAGIEVFPKLKMEEVVSISDKKINLGVRGMEQILNKGVLEGSAILTAGEVGTGKALFGFQFIHEGVKNGEKSLIISLNEDLATITRNAKHFGFEFQSTANNGLVKVLYVPVVDLVPDEHLIELKEALEGVNRVLIDGVSCYQSAFNATSNTTRDYKNYLQTVISLCKSRAITSVFTSDTNPGEYYPSDIAPMMDGIVILSRAEEKGVRRRYIEVIKMRGSAHSTGKKLMDITEKGLEVSPA